MNGGWERKWIPTSDFMQRNEGGRGRTGALTQSLHRERMTGGILQQAETSCRLLKLLRTHLLTPWSKVLLQKLTGSQLLKKFPAFYGTRRFITAFRRVRHLSLS